MQKNWFITGTSTGFGRILTERLLARGDYVLATTRSAHTLDDLKTLHEDRLRVAMLNLTDVVATRRAVDDAFDAFGRIDAVVNNAGYGLFGAAEEVTNEQIRSQIDTNILGSIAVIRAALPHLRKQGGGRILQLSSAGGQTTYPNFSLYHTTKWAIEGFVETVAQEVAPFGIMLTLVEPGAARTSFGTGLISPPPMAVYDQTPAGDVRRAVAAGAFPIPGDPQRMVQAMIDCVDSQTPPLRLTLGSDAYRDIRASLVRRLEALDAQHALALSTDAEVA
jgi:NAD(P)-dependent dehydrogenase (short-subunit alcohol dehydrogenase family)